MDFAPDAYALALVAGVCVVVAVLGVAIVWALRRHGASKRAGGPKGALETGSQEIIVPVSRKSSSLANTGTASAGRLPPFRSGMPPPQPKNVAQTLSELGIEVSEMSEMGGDKAPSAMPGFMADTLSRLGTGGGREAMGRTSSMDMRVEMKQKNMPVRAEGRVWWGCFGAPREGSRARRWRGSN